MSLCVGCLGTGLRPLEALHAAASIQHDQMT